MWASISPVLIPLAYMDRIFSQRPDWCWSGSFSVPGTRNPPSGPGIPILLHLRRWYTASCCCACYGCCPYPCFWAFKVIFTKGWCFSVIGKHYYFTNRNACSIIKIQKRNIYLAWRSCEKGVFYFNVRDLSYKTINIIVLAWWRLPSCRRLVLNESVFHNHLHIII